MSSHPTSNKGPTAEMIYAGALALAEYDQTVDTPYEGAERIWRSMALAAAAVARAPDTLPQPSPPLPFR